MSGQSESSNTVESNITIPDPVPTSDSISEVPSAPANIEKLCSAISRITSVDEMLEDKTMVEQNRMQLQTDISEVETTIDLAKSKLAVFDEVAAEVTATADKAAAEKATAEANATSSLQASSNSDATASSQLSPKQDEADASSQPKPNEAQPNPADLPEDPADLSKDPADLPKDPAALPEDMPPKPAADGIIGGGRYKSRRKGKKTNKKKRKKNKKTNKKKRRKNRKTYKK